MTKLRIGLDLDGCLYDFGNSVRLYLDSIGRTYGWVDDKPEPHDWNFFEYWGMDYAEFKTVVDAGVDAGYVFSGDIRPNAVDAVKTVAALGHEIIIITDREFGSNPLNSHRATEEWLEKWGIEHDELHFSKDKTCVPTDMFVEDKLSNYDDLQHAGTSVFLINRDWNKDPEFGWEDSRIRINDISDYAKLVELFTDRSNQNADWWKKYDDCLALKGNLISS